MKKQTTAVVGSAAGVACTALLILVSGGEAQLTPRQILERVDANMTMSTARVNAQMTITYRDGDVRNLVYDAWAQGTDRSFLEFTAPALDAGSRFLRLEDAMWIFLPYISRGQ